jgi:NAD(P)-dependent dehydrogenase (short-subunit alcohol dehydrogenase family)
MLKTLIVNFQPAYYINQSLIPKLRKRAKRSTIINMSSGTAIHLTHLVGPYGAIKSQLDTYSRTIAI